MGYIARLIGTEKETPTLSTTQVYKATHDREGNRLPFMYRSFISFTYGGRYIEDFGFIVITENNSIQRDLYPEVKNIVTDPEPVDGQFYWGTHYSARKLHLALFTDEITEDQFDEFKAWFQPGVVRELILSQNPFRGIMARIDENITMSMLPFEKKTKIKIRGEEYETSVTSYKGKIDLTFVMDDPLWYSLFNVLDYQTDIGFGIGAWRSFNEGKTEEIIKSKDAIKILYEDRIPTLEMFNTSLSGGTIGVNLVRGDSNIKAVGYTNGDIATYKEQIERNPNGYTENERRETLGELIGSQIAASENDNINENKDENNSKARISGGYKDGKYINSGWVGMRKAAKDNNGYLMSTGIAGKKYLYYAGTAPSYPILTFTLTIHVDGEHYYTDIGNNETQKKYSSFFIRGKKINELKITTPGILTAYNQAIKICSSNISNPLEFKDLVINGINHYKIRDAVMGEITKNNNGKETISELTIKQNLITVLNGKSMTVKINCKTGKTTIKGIFTNNEEEDAGDMILSNYLKIDERNHFTDDGYIDVWESDPGCSQIFYHDLGVSLTNVNLEYRYMYF